MKTDTSNTQVTRGGTSIFTVLLVIFVTLKLVGVITWSWLWVLSPLWIPLLFLLVILLIATALGITLDNR